MSETDWEPLLELVAEKLKQQSADEQGQGVPDSRRLFHGRGRCWPGLEQVCVDSFHPALLVTFFEPHEGEDGLCAKLWEIARPYAYQGVAVQRRYLQGAPVEWPCGQPVPAPVARRGELKFPLTFARQNVGFFLDIEPGRQWLERQVRAHLEAGTDLKMLNLFAFTCAFSVVARACGELKVVNVDLNGGVLKRGRENHAFNDLPQKGIQFLKMDALREFDRFDRRGPFQLAVVDPPTRQKGRFDVNEHYEKLLPLLPTCLADEADLLLVMNSPRHSEQLFREMIEGADRRFEVVARLPQNPDFPDRDPDAALKMLHVRFRR
ncbi:class I SAM-dependent methyltransferase [Microbulbifer yueqingensis]|uniref:23S rRNA (Cytosine1962-C5)-methyltransferase n=1 Tax=Microbulbifer yueqingensis TaxID=658219 RepID=A0A1G9AQP1_9GAMM|nr:class I SAM-dependent methyltransferase [Microbulbifer yueqingensis]SDK29672.1 23S rRNA (cytosine1962-C5)-methyltransferase [Microbulbifer yueqingensis]